MEMATRRREQEVWQACDDLWALSGDLKGLTGDAIRERLLSLGKSRGSPNEIYKYRKSWSASRGVSPDSTHILNSDGDDPITRAVRLVHEKMQAEANEQMDVYKNEMNSQVEAKEALLKKAQDDLALIMEEFLKAQNDTAELKKRLVQNQDELEAEIKVRMALERELNAIKKDFKSALETHDIILNETKNQHQQLVEELKSIFAKQETALSQRLTEIEGEKKALGHQFSEELNEQRTKEYNLKIIVNNLTTKVEEHQAKNLLQAQIIDKSDVKLQEASATQQSLALEVTKLKTMLDFVENKEKKLALELKKSEISLARLRAVLSHQGKRCT